MAPPQLSKAPTAFHQVPLRPDGFDRFCLHLNAKVAIPHRLIPLTSVFGTLSKLCHLFHSFHSSRFDSGMIPTRRRRRNRRSCGSLHQIMVVSCLALNPPHRTHVMYFRFVPVPSFFVWLFMSRNGFSCCSSWRVTRIPVSEHQWWAEPDESRSKQLFLVSLLVFCSRWSKNESNLHFYFA